MVERLGFRDQGAEIRVSNLGFRVITRNNGKSHGRDYILWGLGFRDWGLGIRVDDEGISSQ